MRSEFLAVTETALFIGGSAFGLTAEAQALPSQQPTQPVQQEQVLFGPIPSQQAAESLLARMGISKAGFLGSDNFVLTNDAQNLCPPAGHSDAGDVVYLGSGDTDPACINNGFANPFNNPYSARTDHRPPGLKFLAA